MPAIGAGGTFELLAEHRTNTAQLTDVHRFREPDGTARTWEAEAPLQLRNGDVVALEAYQRHGRIADGPTEQMIDAAYRAWQSDRAAGLDSLLVAADRDTVQALNLTVRADRIRAGEVRPGGVPLGDGTTASVGDRIVARRVDRHLADVPPQAGGTPTDLGAHPDQYGRYASGFVKNGSAFVVTAVGRDGSLRVRAGTSSPETVLPAGYVALHVELGYAVTAHRCQGMTVDTTHTIATRGMTREAFYVAMTRGTRSNRAYVATDSVSGTDLTFGSDQQSRDQVLAGILARRGAERSAHQQMASAPLPSRRTTNPARRA